MASSEAGREDGCAGTSVDAGAGGSGSGSVGGHGGAELRSSSWDQAMESSSSPSTSPPYWDSDDDDPGPRPSNLYGKFTWKIEKFSEISNRELRSNVFEVGGYKWYILVYPQGCDVCNHLSLFLCVSDYDKLLPGWSHFAQFTIAVVNKDPKKSKYSDTLHRFCKKEHDWGWKKFMELSKVLDGFIVADILVIKAQVQVIRENSNRPFRCLDSQYRRELVRVYLTNVEGICRRFVEEKREKLAKLIEDTNRWSSICGFWSAIDATVRHRLSREKTDVILKAIVKRFFNEKEVTSTLVMDALYSGCKALNYRSKSKKEKYTNDEGDNSFPVVWVEKDYFVLVDDVLSLLERVATEPLPPFKEDKGPQNRTKDCSGDDFAKDSVERDERRLTELGKRTIEFYVLAHLFSNRVEVAYREAIALKRQEELIREEEAAGQAEIEFRAKREAAEKEKKSKKKQAKQRRNNRKDKNRVKDEKASPLVQEKDRQELTSKKQNAERTSNQCAIPNLGASTMADEDDELSGIDATDNVVGTLGPATEDGEAYRVDWDRDGSETPQSMEASFSGDICAQPAQSGRSGSKHQATIDDSSSTCSTDSLASIVVNGSYKGKRSVPNHNQSLNWCDRGKSRTGSERCERATSLSEADNLRQAASTDSNAIQDANNMIASLISEKISLKECVQQLGQRNAELEQRNAELEQFKADLEVRSAELERQNAGLLASANAEAKNLSMKDRERQLELSLAEKEAELEMLRAKLKVLQQEMDDLKSSRQTQEKLANTSVKRDSDRAGFSQADESRHTSSSMSSDLSSTNLNKSFHVESPASQATTNNTSNSKSNLPKSNSGKNTMPASYASGKIDNHKSLVHNLNTTELNRNSNTQKTVAGSDENVATVSGQQNSHAASGSSEATDLSRPSSAPLIPAGAKPTMPVVSIQSTPSLSRSVSASGRLGVGESAAASASSLCQSQPVTPSYKMAAVGKIRSQYNGQIPISVSGSNSQIGSSTQNSNLTHLPSTNQMPTAHTASSTLPASPQQNHRMVLNQEGSAIGDCFPSTSAAPCLSIPPVPSSVPGKDHGRYGPSNHIERPVGFTFGSVTPEMLNRQRSRDYAQSIEESMPLMEEESLKIDEHEQQAIFEHYLQHQPQSLQNLKFFQSQDPDPQDLRVHQSALNDLNIQGTPLHLSSIADARQSSSLFSEEFPHIDIINDLLDDEHYRGGRTLSMMLQNSAAHPSHRRVALPGFERSNSSHLHSDLNILKNERPDMSRFQDDGLFQLHSTTDPSNIGFRENLHMLSPYAHSGYGQSYNQQGAMFDGVHHWPMSNADYSGANVNGNAYGSVNGHLGYPLHTNSISLGDCSSFSSGQTDYTMFSPRKDM